MTLLDDVAAEMTKVIPASFANQAASAALTVFARWLREEYPEIGPAISAHLEKEMG